MSIAIMQPYLFPYIGYFQLIEEVDQFVLYDDVNYKTQGWINRNKILINGAPKYFTIPCKDASQNKRINQIRHDLIDKKRGKLLRKIKFSYSNAPFFDSIYPLVESVIRFNSEYIADLAIHSIKKTCSYLGISCSFKRSNECYGNVELGPADRLIDICKQEGTSNYVNPIGGQKLYDKAYFDNKGIHLYFLESAECTYEQFDNKFVPYLSIIDVMMFNSPEKIKADLLNSYKLV